jgi:hypothetical protein
MKAISIVALLATYLVGFTVAWLAGGYREKLQRSDEVGNVLLQVAVVALAGTSLFAGATWLPLTWKWPCQLSRIPIGERLWFAVALGWALGLFLAETGIPALAPLSAYVPSLTGLFALISSFKYPSDTHLTGPRWRNRLAWGFGAAWWAMCTLGSLGDLFSILRGEGHTIVAS